jgi:hypothetical protein
MPLHMGMHGQQVVKQDTHGSFDQCWTTVHSCMHVEGIVTLPDHAGWLTHRGPKIALANMVASFL